jgi:hypothetical protein
MMPYEAQGQGHAFKGNRARKFVQHQPHPQQQQYYQQPYRQQHLIPPQQFVPDPTQMSMFGHELAAGAGHIHPAWQ